MLPSRIGNFSQVVIGRPQAMEDTGSRPLDAGTDRFLLQGYLLKRSETLRRWNKRWFSLDPTTARLEYRSQRSDLYSRGQIVLDANSTVTVSPINFNGAKQYDGCCLYIGTPRKKDYFLAAETPAAARAWVSALRAAMQVLKAHRDAVNALGDAERRRLSEGAVRAAAASSIATAQAMAKEIQAASQKGALQGFGLQPEESGQGDEGSEDGVMDDTTIMKETLRVKDEELVQMAQDLRARDATIREMADRLSETAEAAEAAAAAAMQMDRDRKAAVSEAAQARRLAENALKEAETRIKGAEEKAARQVKALEASREEAVHRAMQWKAEADRAHEKARAVGLALRQAQGSTSTADTHTGPGEDLKAAALPEPLVSSSVTAKAEEDTNAPAKAATREEHSAAGHEESGTVSNSSATPSHENGETSSGALNAAQQGEKEEVVGGTGEAASHKQPDREVGDFHKQEGADRKPVGGVLDSHRQQIVASDVQSSLKHESVEGAERMDSADTRTSVVEGKHPGEPGVDDDLPAMDAGFLASFQHTSVSNQAGDDKPDQM